MADRKHRAAAGQDSRGEKCGLSLCLGFGSMGVETKGQQTEKQHWIQSQNLKKKEKEQIQPNAKARRSTQSWTWSLDDARRNSRRGGNE